MILINLILLYKVKHMDEKEFSIVFVILHFNTVDETNNCVVSIKENMDMDSFHIILVDNASPNKSGVYLQDMYKDDEDVTVILNELNYGFAKGNNVGIDYARNKMNAKFVCCLNNDTLMIQKDFYEQLEKEYEKSKAAVIGPCIKLKNNEVLYYPNSMLNENDCIDSLYKLENNLVTIKTFKIMLRRLPIINRLIQVFRVKRGINNNYRKENVLLQGCCLIFTPSFFAKLSGFNSKTFLYYEEQLLYIDLQRNNLSNVYTPKLVIQHLENVSTNFICKNQKEKREFVRKNYIDSLKILIEELHSYNMEREENGKINQ